MSEVYGRFGPRFPKFGQAAERLVRPLARTWFRAGNFYDVDSAVAENRRFTLAEKLSRGEPVYLVGINPAGHDSGVALVEVSPSCGLRLISNDQEERFTGIKHFAGYPSLAMAELKERFKYLGLTPEDVHAWVTGWDYVNFGATAIRAIAEEMPTSWRLLDSNSIPNWRTVRNLRVAQSTSKRIRELFALRALPTVIAMPHHENHAAFSYAVSPFRFSAEPVLVAVFDAFGDRGSISFFIGESGQLRPEFCNSSLADSIGIFYSIMSSTQGGWPTLSSEGRYMAAAAYGDRNRGTNRYYRMLRQMFYFGADGELRVNRSMANWQNAGELRPLRRRLTRLIGRPCGEDTGSNCLRQLVAPGTEEAKNDCFDLAAATQMVFEDALFHVVEHFIRKTGSDKVVLTGGIALNCLGNCRLLEHFDEEWYGRNLGKKTRLNLWVPPVANDSGVAAGAAFALALRAGAKPAEGLPQAFFCGHAPSTHEIRAALHKCSDFEFLRLGNVQESTDLLSIAELMALIVSNDGVIGLFQGRAEIGPRALGHRSILSNPANPHTLKVINERVKFREWFRPLAPMITLEQAPRFFELSNGAAADDYVAYNFMTLTVPARVEALQIIPAAIHRDGTARIQIVRRTDDPLVYAYLKAMGQLIGAEASMNTSLNVQGPIVQTPDQALDAMRRARGLSGTFFIGDDGDVFLAWENTISESKDGGHFLKRLLDCWHSRSGVAVLK